MVRLREAESCGISRDYARKLLSTFGEAAQAGASLAPGLVPQEIADKLVLTVGTVRNHIESVYGKLDSHNLRQAVERARALRLL